MRTPRIQVRCCDCSGISHGSPARSNGGRMLVLRRALKDAPDGGLILYMQDLELMDFGDVALDIMEEAWKRVLKENLARVHFVTPDEYLEKRVMPKLHQLKRLYFHQISWAPEIRLVLRYDGQYPPLEAGRFRGIDAARDIFRRWPFIFWEPGRYIVRLVNSLLDIFNLDHRVGVSAVELQAIGYQLDELTPENRLALHSRIIKRAWSRSGNVECLLLKMYDYLFELYPPRFPAILESTLTEEEIERVSHPALR